MLYRERRTPMPGFPRVRRGHDGNTAHRRMATPGMVISPAFAYIIVGQSHNDHYVIRSTVTADAESLEALCRACLSRVAAHEETALAELYDATSARVFALAMRLTRQRPSAEEVVSDVYLQVWRQAERYDIKRGNALAWLLMICRSRALDHLRKRDNAENHPQPDNLRPDLFQDNRDPLNVLLTVERDSQMHAALERLDETQQRLLALAFFRGLSHQEIASATGMPLGTVKSILRKTMLSLRETLKNTPAFLEEST